MYDFADFSRNVFLNDERTGLVSMQVVTPSGSALALPLSYGGCAGDVHCRVYTRTLVVLAQAQRVAARENGTEAFAGVLFIIFYRVCDLDLRKSGQITFVTSSVDQLTIYKS